MLFHAVVWLSAGHVDIRTFVMLAFRLVDEGRLLAGGRFRENGASTSPLKRLSPLGKVQKSLTTEVDKTHRNLILVKQLIDAVVERICRERKLK